MKRHQMREYAFILIFEKIFTDETADEILETASECEEIEVNQNVESLFRGVYDHVEELDGIIAKYLKNWSLSRISKVALAILRLAVYEIKYCDEVPLSVSIDEAVELAKAYSTTEDAGFINGALGSYAKELEG